MKKIKECLICGHSLVIDEHHIYNYGVDTNKSKQIVRWTGGRNLKKVSINKVIFLCPNHHAIYHRLVDSRYGYSDYFYKNYPNLIDRKSWEEYLIDLRSGENKYNFFCKNYPKLLFNLKLIKKRITYIDKKDMPYYYPSPKSTHFDKDCFSKEDYPNQKRKRKKRIVAKQGKNYYYKPYIYGKSGVYIHENELIYKDKKPKCLICGYHLVLDRHHIKKDDKVGFFCPNHHTIIHRNLKDIKGDKLSFNDIVRGIEDIEKNL